MNIIPHPILPEVIIFEPKIFRDNRGHFLETYHKQRYHINGLRIRCVKDNLSYSKRGVLRGLHYQLGRPQAKLVWVVQGEVFDVAVDIRVGSPTFGQWSWLTISSTNYRQIYIPEGFAHGFCVTSEAAIFAYKCTDYYAPEGERGILWDDPSLGIDWPISEPLLSNKDRSFDSLQNIPIEELPTFKDERSSGYHETLQGTDVTQNKGRISQTI